MAAQTLARSARTRWNSSTWRASSAPTAAARSAIQSACRERSVLLHAGLPQPLAAELAKRLEEPEPVADCHRCRRLSTDFSTSDPTSSGISSASSPSAGTDRLRRVELEPAGEHGQAGPQQSLGLAQELVAPVDRALERLLPERHAAVARAQRAEPGGEARDRARRGRGR